MPCAICGKDVPLNDKGFCGECAEKLKVFSHSSSGFQQPAPSVMLGLDAAGQEPPASRSPEAAAFGGKALKTGEFGQSEECRLRNPFSVAVDAARNIMVLDCPGKGKYRVTLFSPNGEYVRTVLDLEQGNGPAQLKYPKGIATDAHGNIYIPDAGNSRIQRFSAEGHPLGPVGSPGDGPGSFDFPCDVDVDESGVLYVADTYNSRIQKITPQGVMLLCVGSAGDGEGCESAVEFNEPLGVKCDKEGHIYIADTNNHRLVKCDPEGRVVLTFGKEGTGEGDFSSPSDVQVTDNGTIFVADKDNSRVQKFDPAGNLLAAFTFGQSEQGAGLGGDIAIDSDGSVLICNMAAHTVMRVELLGSA